MRKTRRTGRRLKRPSWIPLIVLGCLAVATWFGLEVKLPGGDMPVTEDTPVGTGSTTKVTSTFDKCRSGSDTNCVVDGDTFRHGSTIIRVEDIDTPETIKASCPEEAALGAQATQRMIQLLNAGPFSVVQTGGRDEDKYGRKLRRVERDGRSLGDVLVREGLAHRWTGRKQPWCS